jgi:hypothetical protein
VSLRDRVLQATASFRPKAIEIPELGGLVYVRPMTVGGVSKLVGLQKEDPGRASALMIIDGLCDEHGVRILTAADEQMVSEWPSHVGNKLIEAMNQASGLNDATAVGDAAGN